MSTLTLKLMSALESRKKHRSLLQLATPLIGEHTDFTSNDYLSLSQSPELRHRFLDRLQAAPSLFGSGGTRVLVNCDTHAALEARLTGFFNAPCALLATSGYDANVAFFRHVPQPGDIVVHDEYIHASIYDGMRSGRARLVSFPHNHLPGLVEVLRKLTVEEKGVISGATSVFLSVESVYSMDGSIAPLKLMSSALEEALPKGNGHLVVDEAHATGIYGPHGRGIVSMCGLEDKCLARLHTFGKALTSVGAVLLTTPLIRDYLLNYGRALLFTTAPSYPAVISVDCTFDILQSDIGARLAKHLLETCTYFIHRLLVSLADIPTDIVRLPAHFYRPISNDVETLPATTLPTAIIPLLTPYAPELSAYLSKRGINVMPVVFPAVPRDQPRIRVTMNADKTREDVDKFVDTMVEWAKTMDTCGATDKATHTVEFQSSKL